ncbi:MAG: cytochrome C [Actinobacteria bacterium 13_1_20CM_3_71_11]|nr:MAG: cytochrome C [Actinobacteria bacterium 13_1_20CM_3_71_11]
MTAAPPDRPARRGANASRGVFARLAAPRPPRSRLRRRLGAGVRMIFALALVGGIYAGFAPSAIAEDTSGLSQAADRGKAIFDQSCASCHGNLGQGVPDKGPSLIGVGSAAVEFQVSTGRMPMARQEAQAERKKPMFTDDQARDIGAYIEALGGGPEVPPGTDLHSSADAAYGGQLFRVNCAACHAFGMGGGALSSGKYAPSIQATDRQIYAAMLSGPQNMPVFSDSQLSPKDKEDIIAYIQTLKQDQDPGGWGLGRLGPVPEGLVIFLVGLVALIFAMLWIAGKS